MTISYKSAKIRCEFENAPIILQLIARDFEYKSMDIEVVPVMTRVLESIKGSSGVYEDYRAVDFR